jgi:hypothetical protein
MGEVVLVMAGPAGPAPNPAAPHSDRTNSGRVNMQVHVSVDNGESWSTVPFEPDGRSSGGDGSKGDGGGDAREYAGYSSLASIPGGERGGEQAHTAQQQPKVGLLYESGGVGGCDGACSIAFAMIELQPFFRDQ